MGCILSSPFTSQSFVLPPLPGIFPQFPCKLQHGQKEEPSNTALHRQAQPPPGGCKQCRAGSWSPLLGQAGWSGYAAPLAQGTPVLPHCPSPREAEQGLSTPGCPVTQRAPAAVLGSTAAMRGCKALRKRGALGMGDFQALSYAAPKEAAARAASASPASLWFHATPAHLPVLGGGLRGLG